MNTVWSYMKKFLGHPITIFLSVIAMGLIVAIFPQREHQIIGIIVIFVVFVLGGLIHTVWGEKISAIRYQDENTRLQTEVKDL